MISIEFLLASGIGLLVATGIYLMLRARTFPVVLGLAVIGYAVNLFLFATGRVSVNAGAILTDAKVVVDPLPQALVLTAIVIGFATTAFVVQLALRSRYESGTDHVDAKEDLAVGDDEVEPDVEAVEEKNEVKDEVKDEVKADVAVNNDSKSEVNTEQHTGEKTNG